MKKHATMLCNVANWLNFRLQKLKNMQTQTKSSFLLPITKTFCVKVNFIFTGRSDKLGRTCNTGARGEVHMDLMQPSRPKLILFSCFVSSGQLQLEGLPQSGLFFKTRKSN
jgi:hypothetical protein